MGIFTSWDANHLPQRGLTRVTIPDERAWLVSLADAKEHLRIGFSDDDTYISTLCRAAQLTCEYFSNIDFTPCAWKFTCDDWDQTKWIPHQKCRTITGIKYYDDNGISTIWGATDYYVDAGSLPVRITLVDGKTYPSLRNGTGNITIDFTTDEYENRNNMVAAQAVLITIADMYENRQSVVVGRIASKIPKTAQYLLDTIKIQTL